MADFDKILKEVSFQTSRSSGPGGQNVNKLNTRVELLFEIEKSINLTDDEKKIISEKLLSKIAKDGVLRIVSQETRSMYKNKEICIQKFIKLIQETLHKPKERIETKIPAKYLEIRMKKKKFRSEKKQSRRDNKI